MDHEEVAFIAITLLIDSTSVTEVFSSWNVWWNMCKPFHLWHCVYFCFLICFGHLFHNGKNIAELLWCLSTCTWDLMPDLGQCVALGCSGYEPYNVQYWIQQQVFSARMPLSCCVPLLCVMQMDQFSAALTALLLSACQRCNLLNSLLDHCLAKVSRTQLSWHDN